MDPYGQQILRNLVDENVNVGFVHEDTEHATGTAYVTAAYGKNAIVVVPSANSSLPTQNVDMAEKFFSTADLVLTQLEIPMNVVENVYQKCKKYSVFWRWPVRLPLLDVAGGAGRQGPLPVVLAASLWRARTR
jgi:ribokinase